ncbi:MAG: hypothetical protein DRN81_01945 [Thermoproteota archaeon]|nr:MAG: hypothetical protein DRN81_01945 [Candidatus Korarchaeota archaeon]
MTERIPFNAWSRERIKQGRKLCTSRTRKWDDHRVKRVTFVPLGFVKDYLWQPEGADSPEEFEKVWRSIFRGNFDPERPVFVHWGDFRD